MRHLASGAMVPARRFGHHWASVVYKLTSPTSAELAHRRLFGPYTGAYWLLGRLRLALALTVGLARLGPI